MTDSPEIVQGLEIPLCPALDRYEFIRLLGQGGTASVFHVLDRLRHISLALKILHPEAAQISTLQARLRREYEILRSINHPSIIRVFDYEESHDCAPFFTLELIEGLSLEKIGHQQSFSLSDSLTALEQIARILGHLHDQGIVFRDLKPSNILLRQPELPQSVVLIDFGLAEKICGSSHQSKQDNSLEGTSIYMAPEQIRAEPTAPSVDIYAFGVVAYEILIGKPPFESNNTFTITSSHLLAAVPDIQTINPNIPKDIARMIRVCMAKEPSDRYHTMWEIVDRLENAQRRLRRG
jgi:serine/threonine protein kinase